jgi:hypothetical protein
MALLYGCAGRLTSKNGGFRPGQYNAVDHRKAVWWWEKALARAVGNADVPAEIIALNELAICHRNRAALCRFTRRLGARPVPIATFYGGLVWAGMVGIFYALWWVGMGARPLSEAAGGQWRTSSAQARRWRRRCGD